mgnify:CR=1 FL=1
MKNHGVSKSLTNNLERLSKQSTSKTNRPRATRDGNTPAIKGRLPLDLFAESLQLAEMRPDCIYLDISDIEMRLPSPEKKTSSSQNTAARPSDSWGTQKGGGEVWSGISRGGLLRGVSSKRRGRKPGSTNRKATFSEEPQVLNLDEWNVNKGLPPKYTMMASVPERRFVRALCVVFGKKKEEIMRLILSNGGSHKATTLKLLRELKRSSTTSKTLKIEPSFEKT